MAGEVITLGKDATWTGISNVREATLQVSYTEIDRTAKGDSNRRIIKGWAEMTIEVTCVDLPGCSAGSVITVSTSNANGFNLSNVKFLVTTVSQSEPLDDIITYTVSATRGVQ